MERGSGMENAFRLIQVVSPGKYVQDMLYFTLILVFFYQETSFPLPYITLVSVLLIAVSATFLYRMVPYSTVTAAILTLLFQSSILLFGGSIVIYLVVSAVSIWRLQNRFGSVQFEGAYDLPFIAIITVQYVILAAASIFFGLKDELALLTALLFIGVIMSVGARLVEQWFKADSLKQLPSDIVKLFAIVTGTGVAAYLVIRHLGTFVRGGIEFIVLQVMAMFLPLIGMVLEKPITWLQELIASREQEEKPRTSAVAVSEEPEPLRMLTGAEGSFPWLPIVIGAALILLIVVIFYMMKKRPEFEQVESFQHEVERGMMSQNGEEAQGKWIYSMDSNIVREAFILFEKEAAEAGFSRNRHETVREWFYRMEWETEPRFFTVYDSVRYGAGKVPEEDGSWFLEHLNQIKIKFLKKDV